MGSLTNLNLDNNSISNIYKETFTGLSSLEVLGLNDNYLSSLSDFVFDELVSINSIHLIDNEIEFISSSTNRLNLVNSINLTISAVIMDRTYY